MYTTVGAFEDDIFEDIKLHSSRASASFWALSCRSDFLALFGMSKDRDSNAPISLDATELNELHSDEQLVASQQEKAKLQQRVQAKLTKKLFVHTNTEKDAQDIIITQLHTKIWWYCLS
ncbi:hypothetical protein B0H13DRAFT_1851696 [Mycena leptocephala]|nr:hypothetical protein B0H13DRAFT_1851696 [Mycena leptocephala]